MEDTNIQKLTNNLDRERIDSYDVSSKIPDDSISISVDLENLEIYIPEDMEYSQFNIDNYLRKNVPTVRTSIDLDDDIYIMKCRGRFRFDQYFKLVKYIIEQEGYCVIIKN